MSLDLEALVRSTRDAILTLYRPPGREDGSTAIAAPTMFLAFERSGIPLPPETFRLPGDDTVRRELAIERLSALADAVPRVSDSHYTRTGFTVRGMYGLLLGYAQAAPGNPAAVAAFEALKADAAKRLDERSLPSLEKPLTRFWPVHAEPANWFDPAAPGLWKTCTLETAKQSGAAVAAPSRPPWLDRWHLNESAEALRPWQLEVVPIDKQEALRANRALLLRDLLETPSHARAQADPAPPPPPATADEATPALTEHVRAGHVQRVARFGRVGGASFAEAAARRIVANDGGVDATSAAALAPPVSQPLVSIDRSALFSVGIRARAEVADLIDSIRPEPARSESFRLSFEVCALTLSFPWMNWELFAAPNWYAMGYPAGDFAPGGRLPAIPVGVVLIRNLVVEFRQSETDSPARSVSFGPFSLMGGMPAVTQTSSARYDISIVSPGMQVIAWLGQALDAVPPLGDPALGRAG